MKNNHKYGSAFFIVIVAMTIVIPLLAYLQYTWVGQISKQEYERMKDNLQTTAFHCSVDFSHELIELMKSLGDATSASNDNIQKIIQEKILSWKITAAYPEIVSAEIKIQPSPISDQIIPVMMDRGYAFFLFKDLTAIVFPIRNRSDRVIVIYLNLDNISSSVLPAIFRSNFAQDTWQEYDIIIINDSGKSIYSSPGSDKNIILKHADIAVPFPMLHPEPPSSLTNGSSYSGRFGIYNGKESKPFEIIPPRFKRMDKIAHAEEDVRSSRPDNMFGGQSLFKMYLKHRNNSLEEIVNNNRLRNIGISFGILIILGISIIFLLHSTNKARRLAEQQLEFVAGISHELRTPLAVLESAGDNIADGIVQEKARLHQYGKLIKNEVRKLSEMVEKALAYAGIQSGNKTYEKTDFDISSAISEAIRNVKNTSLTENIVIESYIEENLPRVHGDELAIRSALENLIVNGIKYSNEEKRVDIKVQSIKKSDVLFMKLTVSDRGIGIAQNDIANIFKPFYRGHEAREQQIRGNGLGLSIAKHIVESHGGTISVKSSRNAGSSFTILLPFNIQKNEQWIKRKNGYFS